MMSGSTWDAIAPMSDRDRIRVVVRAVVRAMRDWGLNDAEAAALFDVPPATWSRMEAETFGDVLDQDKVTRASLILGIYKGLRLMFKGPAQTSWPVLPNKGEPYYGRRPLDVMIAGGIPAMSAVRRHIDAILEGH